MVLSTDKFVFFILAIVSFLTPCILLPQVKEVVLVALQGGNARQPKQTAPPASGRREEIASPLFAYSLQIKDWICP